MIRSGARVIFVKAQDTDWIESDDYYSKLHVGAATSTTTSCTTKYVSTSICGARRSSSADWIRATPLGKATLVLRPFWASKFPADPAKIKVSGARLDVSAAPGGAFVDRQKDGSRGHIVDTRYAAIVEVP